MHKKYSYVLFKRNSAHKGLKVIHPMQFVSEVYAQINLFRHSTGH